MVRDSMRCLSLRPFMPGLTLPFCLHSGILISIPANVEDTVGRILHLSVAFSRKSSRFCSRGSIGDILSIRKSKRITSCQSTIPDDYWTNGMKKLDDIRMHSFENADVRNKEVFENSVWPVKRKSYADERKLKLLALAEGTNIPMSLKKLKQQQRQRKRHESQNARRLNSCSISKAFASMVFIVRSLQMYTLPHFFEDDVQGLLAMVHREMQSSFIWLFQQVFACTPRLMISVMILLANYTVHSMSVNLTSQTAGGATDYSGAVESTIVSSSKDNNPKTKGIISKSYVSGSCTSLDNSPRSVNEYPLEQGGFCPSVFGSGKGKNKNVRLTEGNDGAENNWNSFQKRLTYSQKNTEAFDCLTLSDAATAHEAAIGSMENSSGYCHLNSGPEAVESLCSNQRAFQISVAPVTAMLEPDNYECYDWTELAYQHALGLDSTNSLLPANYAQFLYVVRHDHDRAEACFERAVKMDPLDAEALGRFAMFLWLAQKNHPAAEKIYKSAIAANPADPFHKGNYAHFLWHAQEEESEEESYQPTRSALPSEL